MSTHVPVVESVVIVTILRYWLAKVVILYTGIFYKNVDIQIIHAIA